MQTEVSQPPKPKRRKAKPRSQSSSSTTPASDYVALAIAYAEDAVSDEERSTYGKWTRLAAARFLRDLVRARAAGQRPFTFSPAHANHACGFIETCPHVEGEWDTDTITLHPSHCFFVVNLFGFRALHGGRRFTTALFCVARKNAKSTLAAAIADYCFIFENENGAQLVSAATTGSQARIVFSIAQRMAQRHDSMIEEFELDVMSNSMYRAETGAVFKAINAKASTQDGLNPSHIFLDEIHAHKTADLLNVLRSAAGGRKTPLWLYTTTEGFETPGPWPEIRVMAEHVLQEVIEADHFLCIIYALDDADEATKTPADDDFDESKWIKANPLIDVNPYLMQENRKMAIEARSMPSLLGEFRIKRLNRRSASAKAWVNLARWRECGKTFEFERMRDLPCFAAFDLSTTTDMCAWRILWKGDDEWFTWGRYWVPTEAIHYRTERKSVNYAGWVEAGYLTQAGERTVDYEIVKRDILADYERFNPQMIAYDPFNASHFVNELLDEGVEAATPGYQQGLIQFRQGPQSYNPAMKLCESAYLNGKLRHGGNPVLTWNMANVVPRSNINLDLMPNKAKSPDKIDGACCLFMAFGCAAISTDSGTFSAPILV